MQIILDFSCITFVFLIKYDQAFFLWAAFLSYFIFFFKDRSLISYEIKFHHFWNKSVFVMSSCEYKTICLSSDHKKLIKNLSTHFIFEINNFIKSELILFILKNDESVIEWIIIINQK